MVRNTVRFAVGSDDFLNLSKLVCGHSREQVVFDLAGEAAGAVIDSGMLLYVPACKHLFTQEIYRRAALQKRHTLMIGSEYQRQIQSQKHLLCHEEQDGVPPTEKKTEQSQKPTQVQNEETHFDDGMGDLVAHQEFHTVNFQDKCFKQRQRKETEMLVSHSEACKPAFAGSLVFGKSEQGYIDVGIAGNVVRRAMMRVVFVQPPAVAEAQQKI